MKFLNKVVVITGGASGIGFSAARLFAEQGAIVAINDVRGEAAEKAAAEICAQGGKAFPIPGDVSDIEVVRKDVADVIGKHGRIDVLVNNAAMITLGPAETVPIDAWNKTLAVNVSGAFFWAQTVAAQSMLPNRSGVIINIASIAGLVGGPNMVCYIATKHAVVGLTKALALEWGRRGIRVNALCPGLTETDMVKAVRREKPAMFEVREKRIPLGRVATPEDQAHAILFMSSPEATSVHGLIMNVDGGQVAMSSGYSLDD